MKTWRSLKITMILMFMLNSPVLAEHSPHYDVSCPSETAQIVLDPGHGGPDPGAVNESYGLYERELNLEIARRIETVLERDHGYSVVLTREDNDTELANSERGEIANACEAVVMVMIHLNAATDPDINYSQAFWSEKEKDYALSLIMNQALEPLGIALQSADRFDNGGLLRARMPSVLVEAVFMSNPEEAQRLADGTRQDEIADTIAQGIVQWMELIA